MATSLACRICGGRDLRVFLALGESGLANNLPAASETHLAEPKFPLDVAFCPECALVQLTEVVPPELMFSHYLYVSSTTQMFREHFGRFADDVSREFGLDASSLVVDIGSNDGLLLGGFQRNGARVVGVEPAANIAELAQTNGVPTIAAFFSSSVVDQIVREHGRASVVTANNVFAHIHDIEAVARNVSALLRDDGVFIFEFAYLFDMLDQFTFDLIYHEHLSYYALTPLVGFFDRLGMELFRADHVPTHGGSVRAFVQRRGGPAARQASVDKMLAQERARRVFDPATYEEFGRRVYESRDALRAFFQNARAENRTVAGFGMPAKATTLLNFCGLTRDDVVYIVDDNPLKQGRVTPLGHIPIVSGERLRVMPPDYLVIFAWNFAGEILRKLTASGIATTFVVPLPVPRIVHPAAAQA